MCNQDDAERHQESNTYLTAFAIWDSLTGIVILNEPASSTNSSFV